MYLSKRDYTFVRFQKSKKAKKMYDAVLMNNSTKKEKKLSFGQNDMGNYQDKTGLNLYPKLIHGDPVRRKAFKARFAHYLKDDYYSSAYYSYYFLW
jgi:hypothetical protein